MAAVEMDDHALETVERVLDEYLDKVEPDEVDTADLAANIVFALEGD